MHVPSVHFAPQDQSNYGSYLSVEILGHLSDAKLVTTHAIRSGKINEALDALSRSQCRVVLLFVERHRFRQVIDAAHNWHRGNLLSGRHWILSHEGDMLAGGG